MASRKITRSMEVSFAGKIIELSGELSIAMILVIFTCPGMTPHRSIKCAAHALLFAIHFSWQQMWVWGKRMFLKIGDT
jgi:hypothetical protein